MEKAYTTRSRLRVPVTPKVLRELADRLEHELKNSTQKNQEAELDYLFDITFCSKIEPAMTVYPSVTSEDRL